MFETYFHNIINLKITSSLLTRKFAQKIEWKYKYANGNIK